MPMYNPFDSLGVPTSQFVNTGRPAGVAGFSRDNSVYNLQRRIPNVAAKTTFAQNVSSRVPAGWAVNPYNGRTATLIGNGFNGEQV